MTSDTDRLALLAIARGAIVDFVSGAPQDEPPLSEDARTRSAGVFVTLHRRGELRGCIGHVQPDQPLPDQVATCAVAACSRDPRFPPVASHELVELEIELSILGAREIVVSADDVEIGRHGLLIERGRLRGLLLPQVAAERNWSGRTFLEETCRKAGLPTNAWLDGAVVWRFEAEVFSEAQKVG